MPLRAGGHCSLRGRALEYVWLGRIALFFLACSWLTRQSYTEQSATEKRTESEILKSEGTARQTECMQRDVIYGSRGREKSGRYEVREKQMPGDKKEKPQSETDGGSGSTTSDLDGSQKSLLCFHGCTGVSSVLSQRYLTCNKPINKALHRCKFLPQTNGYMPLRSTPRLLLAGR